MSSQEEANKAVIVQFWEALSARDFDRFKTFFTADAHYTDVCSPGEGATGPDNIVKRLYGISIIAGYEHMPGTNMIAEGDLVMTEHTERWTFEPGKVVDHSFVSVTEMRDGKVCRWHDYSNLGNILENAPDWWIDKIMNHGPAFS